MAEGHITVTVNARADLVQALFAELERLRTLSERQRGLLKHAEGVMRDAGLEDEANRLERHAEHWYAASTPG